MALERLGSERAYRFYLASPLAFADWENPTPAELNANPTNDPDGLVFNLTCAVSVDGTTFDLGQAETDDSLTFCQRAGSTTRLAENPEIVFQIERSKDRWIESEPATRDTANLTFSLLAWRGVEYFAIMSIGEDPDEAFGEGQRIKMARVATDYLVDESGAGEMIRGTQNFAVRGDLNWNFELGA